MSPNIIIYENETKVLKKVEYFEIGEFTLPQSVEIIELRAFWKIQNLTKVVFEDNPNLKHIKRGVFSECINLTEIDLSKCQKLTMIERDAFYNCRKLTEIYIPSSVISLGIDCFSGCWNLIKIDIPFDSQLLTIENFAFYSTKINSIFIPKNLTFYGSSFVLDSDSENIMTFQFHPDCKYYNDSSFIYDKANTTIFYSLGSVDMSNIPKTVTTINSYAFIENSIRYIEIPPQITYLSEYAFSKSKIKEIVFKNDKIKKIPDFCFSQNYKVYNIILPQSIESIGTFAFDQCYSLSKIAIPQNVKHLDATWCTTEFIISNDFIQIDLISFSSITYLNKTYKFLDFNEVDSYSQKYFNLYKGLIIDDEERIINCLPIKYDVIIPDDINVIASGAFKDFQGSYVYCRSNSKLTTIQYNAFISCPNLKNIPNSTRLQSIGSNAFKSCRNLTCINLPPSLTTIGRNAFQDTSIVCCTYNSKVSSMRSQLINSGIQEQALNCKSCVSIPTNIIKYYGLIKYLSILKSPVFLFFIIKI